MFHFLLIIAVSMMVTAQIMIKVQLDALRLSAFSIWDSATAMLSNTMLWAAVALLVVAAGLWYLCISRLPLSVAFFFASLAYPMILAGGYLFLNEQVSTMQILGCILIVSGVLLVALS